MDVAQCFGGHLKDFAGEPIVDVDTVKPIDHAHTNPGNGLELRCVPKQGLDENISSSLRVTKAVNVLPQFFDALECHVHEVIESSHRLPALFGCRITVLTLHHGLHQPAHAH